MGSDQRRHRRRAHAGSAVGCGQRDYDVVAHAFGVTTSTCHRFRCAEPTMNVIIHVVPTTGSASWWDASFTAYRPGEPRRHLRVVAYDQQPITGGTIRNWSSALNSSTLLTIRCSV